MIIVHVSHKQLKASGCSGSYYRVNASLGVKVGAESSDLLHEFQTLTALHELLPGRWPQPYGLVWVKRVGHTGRKKGLLMEHIPGKMLSFYEDAEDEKINKKAKVLNRKARAVLSYCKKRGISWGDDHAENMIISKNKIRFVDAEDVHIRKKRRKK